MNKQKHYVTYNRLTLPLTEWAEYLGIERGTLSARLHNPNWTTEQALFTLPVTDCRKLALFYNYKAYIGSPCDDCGYQYRYTKSGRCAFCSSNNSIAYCEKLLTATGNPRQLARDAGEMFYEGRVHKCGYNLRYTSSAGCVYCTGGA